MYNHCCVENCVTRLPRYRFPNPNVKSLVELFDRWVANIRNPAFSKLSRQEIFESYVICQQHFPDICVNSSTNKLKKGAIPYLYVPGIPDVEIKEEAPDDYVQQPIETVLIEDTDNTTNGIEKTNNTNNGNTSNEDGVPTYYIVADSPEANPPEANAEVPAVLVVTNPSDLAAGVMQNTAGVPTCYLVTDTPSADSSAGNLRAEDRPAYFIVTDTPGSRQTATNSQLSAYNSTANTTPPAGPKTVIKACHSKKTTAFSKFRPKPEDPNAVPRKISAPSSKMETKSINHPAVPPRKVPVPCSLMDTSEKNMDEDSPRNASEFSVAGTNLTNVTADAPREERAESIEMDTTPIIMPSLEPSSDHTYATVWQFCCIENCPSKPPIKFYRFPSDDHLCRIWVNWCNESRLKEVSFSELRKQYCLCANHFEKSQFVPGEKGRLIKHAVPTVFQYLDNYCVDENHLYFSLVESQASNDSQPTMRVYSEPEFQNETQPVVEDQPQSQSKLQDVLESPPDPQHQRRVLFVPPNELVPEPEPPKHQTTHTQTEVKLRYTDPKFPSNMIRLLRKIRLGVSQEPSPKEIDDWNLAQNHLQNLFKKTKAQICCLCLEPYPSSLMVPLDGPLRLKWLELFHQMKPMEKQLPAQICQNCVFRLEMCYSSIQIFKKAQHFLYEMVQVMTCKLQKEKVGSDVVKPNSKFDRPDTITPEFSCKSLNDAVKNRLSATLEPSDSDLNKSDTSEVSHTKENIENCNPSPNESALPDNSKYVYNLVYKYSNFARSCYMKCNFNCKGCEGIFHSIDDFNNHLLDEKMLVTANFFADSDQLFWLKEQREKALLAKKQREEKLALKEAERREKELMENQPCICEKCGMLIENRKTLGHHQKYVCPSALTCNICFKVLGTAALFRGHMKKHKFRTVPCKICNKQISEPHIPLHMKSHDRQIICGICDKKFGTTAALKQHRKSHSKTPKPKLSICSICNRNFEDSNVLLLHMSLKHATFSYICHLCGHEYTSNIGLRKHVTSHEGLSTCMLCDQICVSAEDAWTHRLQSHSAQEATSKFLDRDLGSCNICGAGFQSLTGCREHMKTYHIGEGISSDQLVVVQLIE